MKIFLKILALFLISLLGIIYLAFLIVPYFINLDKFKSEIQKPVLENSKLNLDYSKLKLYSTPLLSFGVVLEDVKVSMPDNSTLFRADKIKTGIALPSLLTLTIKTALSEIENPQVNLDIVSYSDRETQYKIAKLVEEIINENLKKPKQEPKQMPLWVETLITKIKIKVPSVKLTNLDVEINELKTKNNLSLKSNELVLGYNSAKNTAKIKSDIKLLSNKKENIIANIDVISVLPKFEKSKDETDPDEEIKLPFINIVEIYQKYDLNAQLNSKLRIKNSKDDALLIFGFLNVDDLNLKLSNLRLPNSFLHADFKGEQVNYESSINVVNKESLNLSGYLKHGKHSKMKTTIVCDKIHFTNLVDLLKGLLDSLSIKNNLAQIKTTGYLSANATFKTNFKKIKSEGSVLIKDGSFINPLYGIGITNLIAKINLDNDTLKIQDATATINNSKLNVNGSIDNNSNVNIKIDTKNLSIPPLFNAFAPKELKRAYKLNSLNASFDCNVFGKLDEINAKLNAQLNNLNLSDVKNKMIVSNNLMNMDFDLKPNTFNGDIKNNGFNFILKDIKTFFKVNELNIKLDNDKITINPFDVFYNNISKTTVKGEISNYFKNPDIDIFLNGSIPTKALRQTLGDSAIYTVSKGSIPFKVSVRGDKKKQEILAQIYSDINNYLTPIDLADLKGSASLLNFDIKLNGSKIKIKDSGLYKKANFGFSDDLKANLSNSKQLVDFVTIIEGNHINLLKLNILKPMSAKISIFKKSALNLKGKLTLHGYFDNLNYGGDLRISNLSIPEFLLKVKEVNVNPVINILNVGLKETSLNNQILNTSFNLSLKPAKVLQISSFNLSSNYIDVDSAMKVLDSLNKNLPQPTKTSSKVSSSQADIPVALVGSINIKKLKSGQMVFDNIKAKINILKNDLILSNLNLNGFEGNIDGQVRVNLLSSEIKAKLNGKNINTDSLLKDAANMKDTISGKMKFKTDISLKGATYLEQVKSLEGKVDFEIKDGQYGPFAKLENFFLAKNIRENPIFKNSIGLILSPLTTIDSSHFEELKGDLTFKDGIAQLSPITSQGDILCILIKGNMDLVKNEMNTSVMVRLASAVSDLLGPIALANPVNLIKNTPGLNVATASLFSIFTQVVDEKTYAEIPDFNKKHSDANATKFRIILKGDVSKPLKLIDSFKWLALKQDMEKATEFRNNYVKEQEQLAKQALIDKLQNQYEEDNKLKVGAQKILKLDTTAPEVKEILVNEVIKTQTQTNEKINQGIQKTNDKINENLSEVKNKIETKQKESNQKVLNFENQLKDKINSKLPTVKTQPQVKETVEETVGETKE